MDEFDEWIQLYPIRPYYDDITPCALVIPYIPSWALSLQLLAFHSVIYNVVRHKGLISIDTCMMHFYKGNSRENIV